MTRTDVFFSSAGEPCAAWLYRPESGDRAPLIVMAHGFSATRELRLDAYAERFCAAGIGALVFDYRCFGASGGLPRQLLDIPSQHADYRAAVSYARGLDWVDADRIALFGSSFSGGHVIAIASQDPRIAAVVSQCPFTDALASLPKMGVKNIAKATVAGVRDEFAARRRRERVYIPAIGAVGSFAVMTAPDVAPGFAAMTPEPTNWENRVAAQIAIRIASYRPGRAASAVRCPILFSICDSDSLAPAKATARYAATAPKGEVKHYPVGHFEIYLGDAFERAVGDQTEFLTRHLSPGPVLAVGAVAAAR